MSGNFCCKRMAEIHSNPKGSWSSTVQTVNLWSQATQNIRYLKFFASLRIDSLNSIAADSADYFQDFNNFDSNFNFN